MTPTSAASTRLYTKDHAWVVVSGTRARVGISEFAQAELGDIAYVELPRVGKQVRHGETACTVDSLKTSSEIYAPVSGTVIGVNSILASDENCGLINRDPLGDGWLFDLEMSDPAELASLLPEKDYLSFVEGD
ncbi:MAG TPA: glycine cleavage system protein GcvH [Spirochaetia bacterium]|nr:glycine cleavage system protein GcvH [Spirochaetia bacterium]